jgi:hypothetical protein
MAEFLHVLPDSGVVLAVQLRRPIVFVSKTPTQDTWMVSMLIDHRAQKCPPLVLEGGGTDTTATPWKLFPNQDSEFVAEI